MKIIDEGIVFRGEKGTNRQSCAFPGICAAPNGRLLCACRAAPTKNAVSGQHVLLTWSDDEGKTWRRPFAPFDSIVVNGKQGVFRAAYLTPLEKDRLLAALLWVDNSNPSLPFFNPETEGILEVRTFLSHSSDNGATWSAPQMVDTTGAFDMLAPLTGPVLRLSNGELACQFELNKHYHQTSVWRHSSVMMFSKDGGKTWPDYVITSNDPENRVFYWDQRPGVIGNGKILDLFWTYDNRKAVYLNIHARESLNNGRAWSEVWDTGVPGQPAPPVSLPDSGLAMVYVDRTESPAIKMRVSHDGGRTWPGKTEGVIFRSGMASQTERKGSMQDAWAEMGKFAVGLPATASLPNGDFFVVYYAGPETDTTDVRWARARA